MRLKLIRLAALLTLSLAICGFGSCGQVVKPNVCPKLPPVPPSLLDKTDYAAKVQSEFYEPSKPSKPSETGSGP